LLLRRGLMPMRHKFTSEESQRGGKARAKQPDFVEACRKGFAATKQAHPYYVRHEVSRKLQPNKQARNEQRRK
jgi:hypothetical protein